MNIEDIITVWLYAYSSKADSTAAAFHTVFVATEAQQRSRGRAVLAQTSLSYLAALPKCGAGTLVTSYTPPFGPPFVTKDFKDNSLFAPNAIAVTFELAARGSEAYASGTIFLL